MNQQAERELSVERTVSEVLARAGVEDALAEALTRAQQDALPLDTLATFFEEHLFDALVGRVHPVTARGLVDELLEATASRPMSGTHPRQPDAAAPTLPPPSVEGASDAYDDLATGAVHTRPTPTWGLRPVHDETLSPVTWLLISKDPALLALAKHGAPAGTDVVTVSTTATLEDALAERSASIAVVLDARAPSIDLDGAIDLLAPCSWRILVWRMERDARRRLLERVPSAQAWLPCDAEVTPAELLQLLGLEAQHDD